MTNMNPATTPAKPVIGNSGGSGKHVPSSVPGAGPVDHSAAVGSNVDPGPQAQRQASDAILDTPPWQTMGPSMTPYVPLG